MKKKMGIKYSQIEEMIETGKYRRKSKRRNNKKDTKVQNIKEVL